MKRQKTGGRQKGTPNKMTAEKREFLGNLLSDNYDLIRQDFLNLDSYQRCNILVKILSYIMPKVQPVSETEEQKRAAEQLSLYGNIANKVFFWEQQKQKQLKEQEEQQKQQQMQQEEAKQDYCLNSSTLDNPSSVSEGNGFSSSAESSTLQPSTEEIPLSCRPQLSAAQSPSEPNLNSSTLDPTTFLDETDVSPTKPSTLTPKPSLKTSTLDPGNKIDQAIMLAYQAAEAIALNSSNLDNDASLKELIDKEMENIMRKAIYDTYAPLLDKQNANLLNQYTMEKTRTPY